MRTLYFYRLPSGDSPVEEFLDSLNSKQAQKVVWVLKLIEEIDPVPQQYLKKLVSTDDIWEIRIKSGNEQFRLLCFFDKGQLVILTNGFIKRTQKVPRQEIILAEQRKKDYLHRKKNNE